MGGATEQVFLASPTTGRDAPALAAPWLFTGEDNLRIRVVNAQPGIIVTLVARFLQTGTQIPTVAVQALTPTADRMVNTFDLGLGTGFLLNCSVTVTTGSPVIGQTYVMLQAIRGLGGATIVVGALLGGYVTASQHLAYPGSPIQSSIDGGGYPRSVTGTTPAAGAEISETCPTGARWQLLALSFTLTTSVAGGTRVPVLRIAPVGANVFVIGDSNGVGASIVQTYSYAPGVQFFLGSTVQTYTYPIPIDITIRAGGGFSTATQGLQPGDQYSAPSYLVREWLEAA